MTSRFVSNLTLVTAGAFLVAASLGFAETVTRWLAFGVGCVAVAVVACAFRGRGAVQRSLDAGAVLAAAWTIVAARSFGGAAAKWLAFGEGALPAYLGLVGMVVHEVLVEIALRRAAPRSQNGSVVSAREPRSAAAAR